LFQKYGEVVNVTVPLEYHSRLAKGYAFIEFDDARDAEEALHRLNRTRVFGKEIEIEFARGDRKCK
jgi:RNA recognition motif-containing protein